MIAAIYIPLWVPALGICLLCLLPDAFGLARGIVRSIAARRRRRRLLERLWRDEVGVGRGVIAPSIRAVATTPMADTSGFIGDAA